MKLPLIRICRGSGTRPILRYGVALTPTVLALYPSVFCPHAGKPPVSSQGSRDGERWYAMEAGLARTSFALTVSAYFR